MLYGALIWPCHVHEFLAVSGRLRPDFDCLTNDGIPGFSNAAVHPVPALTTFVLKTSPVRVDNECPPSFAGSQRSTHREQQEEHSGTFSARALRRSGWQPPPPHRSDPSHSHDGRTPRAATSQDQEYTSGHSAEAEQSPRRRRRRSAQQEVHENSGWESTPSPSTCLLYTSPSPRDLSTSRMPSSA